MKYKRVQFATPVVYHTVPYKQITSALEPEFTIEDDGQDFVRIQASDRHAVRVPWANVAAVEIKEEAPALAWEETVIPVESLAVEPVVVPVEPSPTKKKRK